MGATTLTRGTDALSALVLGIGFSGCSASADADSAPIQASGSGQAQGGGTPGAEIDSTPPSLLEGRVVTDDLGPATVGWFPDKPAVGILSSGDSVANGTDLGMFAFVPEDTEVDETPPKIGVLDTVHHGTSVLVTWLTDEPATTKVQYGFDTGYGEIAPEDGSHLTTHHVVELADLLPETFYQFRVISVDFSGNESIGANQALFTGEMVTGDASVSGELVAWHPLTVDFQGPAANETDPGPNPFLDYRLTVTFAGPSGQSYEVPGFFAGDGEGGGSGDVWRARFAADEGGVWSYEASFRTGTNIAVSTNPEAGTPLAPDGASGTVAVAATNSEAEGFLSKGRLEYVGEHYLRFREGGWFIKGGTDSPENFLGYRGFDNTVDQPGGISTAGMDDGVHRYNAHVSDFEAGDPLFASEDSDGNSRGIIGALNYLASVHVNSVYFLPMNLGGDGRDTYPFVGAVNNSFDKTHYDVSKLHKWNIVLEHATRRGILLHIVLGETETENEDWLDGGALGVERKLFYREMIARFGHNPALKWNLSEESDLTNGQVEAFAGYIQDVDPYDHPIAFHTKYLAPNGNYSDYDGVLGDERFSMTSIQGAPEDAGSHVEKWRTKSADAGHPWVIDIDELGPASEGLTDANIDERRKTALWDVYLGGGHIEWYAGYHDLPLGGDLRLEDFRTREPMWNYMWYARRFLQENLRFWEMEPMDELVTGESGAYGGAEVLAKPNDSYAVYFPDAGATGVLDLADTGGTFVARWYNPRTGEFVGEAETVNGGGSWTVGSPPGTAGEDWVLLLKR